MSVCGRHRCAAAVDLRPRETAFIAFTALFPVACQVVTHGPAFSGLRHFLFVVPPLAVLAGIGFDAALTWLEARHRAFAAAAYVGLAAALAWPASVMVRLHPYEYLFFNPLVGGLQGAARATTSTIGSTSCTRWWSSWRAISTANRRAPREATSSAVCGERLPFEKEAEAATAG